MKEYRIQIDLKLEAESPEDAAHRLAIIAMSLFDGNSYKGQIDITPTSPDGDGLLWATLAPIGD